MITYECGCVNDIEPSCGALRSVSKCDHHKSMQRDIHELGEDYYAEVGCVDGKQKWYCDQFIDCFGEVPDALRLSGDPMVIEVGGGSSMYAGMFLDRGWSYLGIEPSRWAAEWTQNRYVGARVIMSVLDEYMANILTARARAVLCSHALEHMAQPFEALSQMAQMLVRGGLLYLIIPDDTDPVNPDHLFFFNIQSLTKALENAGFAVESMNVCRVIERENFLYALARKL